MDLYDLLNELKESPQELYAYHRSPEYSDSPSDDTDSEDSTDHLKPPLYTIDELNQNLVRYTGNTTESTVQDSREEKQDVSSEEFDRISALSQIVAELFCEEEEFYSKTGNFDRIKEKLDARLLTWQVTAPETDGHSVGDKCEIPEDSEQTTSQEKQINLDCTEEQLEIVSKKLGQLITNNMCLICERHTEKGLQSPHYASKKHFQAVDRWLDIQTADLQQPVQLELLYCKPCNEPLPGNSTAKDHYQSTSHIRKSEKICMTCNCFVKEMTDHLRSRRHLKYAENERTSESQEEYPALNKSEDVNETLISEKQSPSYASTLKNNHESLDDIQPVENQKPSELTSESKTDKILRDFSKFSEYLLKLFGQYFCYICNVPATNHYTSQEHAMNLVTWFRNNNQLLMTFNIYSFEEIACLACRLVFKDSSSAESHYASDYHQGYATTFCKKCLRHDDPAKHEDHQEAVSYGILKNTSEAVCSLDPAMIIASNLQIMCTPVDCKICHLELKANHHHYLDRNHIFGVRSWISHSIQQIKVPVDPKLIYCEPCGVILRGTSSIAQAHYQLQTHQMNQANYCAACAFRGTHLTIFQHYYTPEHQVNTTGLVANSMPKLLIQGNTGFLTGPYLSYQPPNLPINQNAIVANSGNVTVAPVLSSFIPQNQSADIKGLYKQFNEQVDILVRNIYLMGNISIDHALNRLRRLNSELVSNGTTSSDSS